jgi:phosphotransferase system enzyme I (PtsP)
MQRVDFVSVGSNDLVQYLTAADRDNRRVANRYDVLSAPLLRAFKAIADKGAETGTPVALCGEMGGRPIEAMALVALGYRSLSMSPSNIGPVKAMVLKLDAGDLRSRLCEMLKQRDGATSLRPKLQAYAEAKGIPL